MDPITISVGESGHFEVSQGALTCDGLGWDEMLGQIVNLTHSGITRPRLYPMLTRDEIAERRWRHVLPVESECDDWPMPNDDIPF